MTAGTTRVYLALHGRTALNAEGRLRGLSDPPLDDIGVAEEPTGCCNQLSFVDGGWRVDAYASNPASALITRVDTGCGNTPSRPSYGRWQVWTYSG